MPGPAPSRGQVVRVRQRQYLVEEAVPPASAVDATLVRLACLDDDAQGQPLEVLWDLEPDAEVLNAAGWDRVAARGFDAPGLFASYVHTLRWNCVTAANPRLFQAPFRAGIKLDAYQIEPLRKALLLPRVNLFIADDVGLGKTIEAGLIARELLLRKKVRDVVVACPPSILPQWQDELETRFGLTFQVIDREYFLTTRRERGYATNPWATHTRFLISHRLLIDEPYAGPLRDWLGEFRPGSLLILDEAHHAAPASGTRYAIDSKITRAARDLAPRFEHRLFLSATPHNGHSNSFSSLLEILDPQRFCRGVPVKDKKVLEAVMVRRLKEDIRAIGVPGFPHREVVQIDIEGLPVDAPELRLSALLDLYRTHWEERLKGATARKQAVAMLLVSGLQQRLLSSVDAFARTLKVHRATVARHRAAGATGRVAPSLFDLIAAAPGADDDRAAVEPDELGREEDAQVEAATEAAMAGTADEGLRLLDEMTDVAENARGRPDARVRKFVAWVKANLLLDGARWNDRRVEPLGLAVDPELVEPLPVAVQELAPDVQHGLGAGPGPVHPGPLQPVLHVVPAGPLDHPAGDRVPLGQVLVVPHPPGVLRQIPAGGRQPLPLRPAEPPLGPHLPQPADDPRHLPPQHPVQPVANEAIGYEVPDVPPPKSIDAVGRQWTASGEDRPTPRKK